MSHPSINDPFSSIEAYNELLTDYMILQIHRYQELHRPKPSHLSLTELMTKETQASFPPDEEYLQKLKLLHFLILRKETFSEEAHLPLPFRQLCNQLTLTPFEEHCLLLGLVSSMNSSFGETFSSLDERHRVPTLGLAIEIFKTHTPYFFTAELFHDLEEKLFHYLFIKKEEPITLSSELVLTPRVIEFLFGMEEKSYDYHFISLYKAGSESLSFEVPLGPKLLQILKQSDGKQLIYLTGPRGIGKRTLMHYVSNQLSQNLLFIDFLVFIHYEEEYLEEKLLYLLQEGMLQKAIPCFYNYVEEKDSPSTTVLRIFERLFKLHPAIILMQNESSTYYDLTQVRTTELVLPLPSLEVRQKLWEAALLKVSLPLSLEVLNTTFEFTPGQILGAAAELKVLAQMAPLTSNQVKECCYHQIISHLSEQAEKIKLTYRWEDLVLPESLKAQMQEACSHIKYAPLVYEKWQFNKRLSYGKGLSMLFAGPSGTGKTMAAQVIAKELHMDLYKVDLSRCVSKYIGETEKNLHLIFEEAKKSNVILFFDEMDALFGKRSETQGANDKYSNMETSYLLQKVEEYPGVVLLATNYLNNIDEAFMRRIQFILHFPFPTLEYRLAIWKNSFPPEAPLNPRIDFDYLAKNFEIPGGVIKNVILSAAFYGALQGEITMEHIIKALYLELSKQGKIVLKEDFGDYAFYLDEE